MRIALELGWRPADFWEATLAEVELALWCRVDAAERERQTTPLAEDDLRSFYDRMRGTDHA